MIGDTSTYDVTRFGQRWACNCAWGLMNTGRPCSHVLAVQAATPESQAPVSGLASLIKDGLVKRQNDALAASKAEFDELFWSA